jgi:UTP:GlnB (protein PII) uridylyltransferase
MCDIMQVLNERRVMDVSRALTKVVMEAPSLVRSANILDNVPVLRDMNACRHENQYHNEGTVLDHCIEVVRHVPASPLLKVAALFHDCGKPETKVVSDNGYASYHKHERVGESIARRTLPELGYNQMFVDVVCLLIRHHMYPLSYINQGPHSDKSVRRFIRRFDDNGLVNPIDLLNLNRADILAHTDSVVERSMFGHVSLRQHVERLIDDGSDIPH